VSSNCSKQSGNCQCKLNYGGTRCEVCADGYFDAPGCSYCDCDRAGTTDQVGKYRGTIFHLIAIVNIRFATKQAESAFVSRVSLVPVVTAALQSFTVTLIANVSFKQLEIKHFSCLLF